MKLSNKEKQLRLKLSVILPELNERQRRILIAAEAKAFGRGGVQSLARITGVSRQTIYSGFKDLNQKKSDNRIRRVGAGRKKTVEKEPDIINVL